MTSTVRFLRAQAKAAGDVRTPMGQAIHRAAARVIRLEEDLNRVRDLERGGTETDAEAAMAVYEMTRRDVIEAGAGSPPLWAELPDTEQARWIRIVRVVRGGPTTLMEADD